MLCLGYRPKSHKKGAYVDGHKGADIVECRDKYLDMMKQLCDTYLHHLQVMKWHQFPLMMLNTERNYHDECIFNTNEGQLWAWAAEDDDVIQPKTKGAGIMISDYVDQHSFLTKVSLRVKPH